MSIGNSSSLRRPTMSSEKHKSKSEKKHKSSNGEKKRKRGQDEDVPAHKSNSKKQKSAKVKSSSQVTTEDPAALSPFHVLTASLYLPLAPISQRYPLEGLCAEHLSPLILTYYPPFDGVVLSYSRPRMAEEPFGDDGKEVLLRSIDEYAVSWAWVTAEFMLFKPAKGAWLEGYINLQTDGHLGIVCWNLFNASIERKRLPPDWQWKDKSEEEAEEGAGEGETYDEKGAGYYVDGDGDQIDGMVRFRVRDIETGNERERGFLTIAGTLLSEEAEEKLMEAEAGTTGSKENAGIRLGGARALGATSMGAPVIREEGEERKKRRRD